MKRAMALVVLVAGALSACAMNPKVETAEGKQVDLRQRGAIGRLTGADVPLSLCAKGARVACSTGLLGASCYRLSSMCNSAGIL